MYATQSLLLPPIDHSRSRKMRDLLAENERLKSRLAKAMRESRRDALTGLSNRRQFDASISRQIRRRCRAHCPIGLLFIDADHFKRINDTFGHAIGDLALQHLARILRESTGDDELVCRFGGEEFVVLTGCVDSESLQCLGERIREAVEQSSLQSPAGPLKLTVSVGGALIEAATETFLAARLLHLADQAVYAAKASGRNCVRIREAGEPEDGLEESGVECLAHRS